MDDLHAHRLARLEWLQRDRFEDKPGLLAKAIGVQPAQVSQWGSGFRSISEGSARRIEKALGLPKYWMDDPMPSRGEVDRPLILPTPTMPPLIPWEALEVIDLPNEFSLLMPDDAMAPMLAKGTQAQFRRASTAAPGDVVLARASQGLVVRELRMRADGALGLFALQRAYEPLSLGENGATIVAIFTDARMTAQALRALSS